MIRICLMFLTHFVADFLLQSREMGKNKSSSYTYLGKHVGIIFLAFLPFGFLFAILNALVHAIIDRTIWNVYKLYVSKIIKIGSNSIKFFTELPKEQQEEFMSKAGKDWEYWEDHWFYATIGFDQLLHGLTIIILAGVL